ncbi:MAG: hypothetical protein F4Y86_16680 [Gammaproteobacteria bacterium]|nr:hypothetical protein [Gammaproteobacteria bacterium]
MRMVEQLAKGSLRVSVGLVALVALNGCIISVDVEDVGMFEGGWSESERDLSANLTKIDYQGGGTLYVVQGDDARLRLQGSRAALDAVSVNQTGATLHITERKIATCVVGVCPSRQPSGEHLRYYLEIPDVEDIRHSGSGELKVGPLTTQRLVIVVENHVNTKFSSINVRDFALQAQDHADIHVETLDADEVSLAASSHADVYAHDVNTLELQVYADDHAQVWLAGRADEANVRLSDHASFDASRVEVDVVDIRADDLAVARLWAEESLRIYRDDRATVDWTGSAEVREQHAVSGH